MKSAPAASTRARSGAGAAPLNAALRNPSAHHSPTLDCRRTRTRFPADTGAGKDLAAGTAGPTLYSSAATAALNSIRWAALITVASAVITGSV